MEISLGKQSQARAVDERSSNTQSKSKWKAKVQKSASSISDVFSNTGKSSRAAGTCAFNEGTTHKMSVRPRSGVRLCQDHQCLTLLRVSLRAPIVP